MNYILGVLDWRLVSLLLMAGGVALVLMAVTLFVAPRADFEFRPVRVLAWTLTRGGALALLAVAAAGLALLPRLPTPCGVSGEPLWCTAGVLLVIGVGSFSLVALLASMFRAEE